MIIDKFDRIFQLHDINLLNTKRKMGKINNKKDILLLLLYSSGMTDRNNEPIRGRTRLVKLLFLFCKEGLPHFKSSTEISEENFYKFFPWFFGPFSNQVYDDINFFQLRGFIELQDVGSENSSIAFEEYSHYSDLTGISYDFSNERDEFVEQEIILSEKGVSFTKNLYDNLSSNQKKLLKNFKKKFNSTPLKAILRYVYKQYPEMAENSTIKKNILGDDD